MEKKILDACCGSRMFWFDKKNPNVLFMDKRAETLSAKDVLKVIPYKPLFGHTTGRQSKTIWMCFMKIDN